MITHCRHCDVYYWRYRRDHPPRSFCSVACHDAHAEGKPAHVPEPPQDILAEMVRHRGFTHGTDSILKWFDCEACERLEERYNLSLAFYLEHPATESTDRHLSAARERQQRVKQAEFEQAGAQ
jgi:hypothetical protein